MRITSAGNVGIGTSSPTARLTIDAPPGDTLIVQNAATSAMYVRHGTQQFYGYINTTNVGGTGFPLILNQSGGNVGIGLTSPAVTLDMLGFYMQGGTSRGDGVTKIHSYRIPNFANATNPLNVIAGLSTSGTNQVYIGGNDGNFAGTAATSILFYTGASNTTANGTERMRINVNGDIGIGTSSPNLLGASKGVSIDGSASAILETNIAGSRAGSVYSFGSSTIIGEFRNLPLVFNTNNTERMRIAANGDVGIGTSSPGYRLSVASSSNDANNSLLGSGIVVGTTIGIRERGNSNGISGTAYASQIYQGASGGGNLEIYNVAAGYGLIFGTNTTERMRIDSSGNLCVGTTNADPIGTRVNGTVINAGGNGIDIRQVGNTSDWGINATSGNVINFYSDNGSAAVYSGSISVNGIVTTYGSVSDYRLKENVVPMTEALAKVQLLKPVTFDFKDGGQKSQGFIAHELQEICPDAVVGKKDAIDEEGNPVYQGIDTSFLVATLTAAIQEQQTLINNLTTRLNALEGK
jgi:hypothetical protein